MMTKAYLGYGLYVDTEGMSVILTAEKGGKVYTQLVLEPDVYEALFLYVKAFKERRAAHK